MSAPGSPRVGVGVLIVGQGDQALLTLRRNAPEAGAWSILGGRVELFETLAACAVREVREEAGVEIELGRLLCITDHILRAEHDHWVSPAFLARIRDGSPENREPEKSERIEWFPLTALPQRLTLTARRAIDAYVAISRP